MSVSGRRKGRRRGTVDKSPSWGTEPERPPDAVDRDAIRLVARTAARLSIDKPAAGGVLAWTLYARRLERMAPDAGPL
jgi:hypothetical protein